MPVVRFAPGEIVPWKGTYVLVGHYGESTDFAVRCEPGERLPRVTVAADLGLLWFVRVDEAHKSPRAA